MLRRPNRTTLPWGWLALGLLGPAQAQAQRAPAPESWGGPALLIAVLVLIPLSALLLPKLLERRLVALMFKRSEELKDKRGAAAALPGGSEVRSKTPLDVVEIQADVEIPGAAQARAQYTARWIALFRKALWCDLGVALSYIVLTGTALAITQVQSDLTWTGPALGVLYLLFSLVRYWRYFPKFHTGDSQIGAPSDDMARFAIDVARGAAGGPLGWLMLFVTSLLTLTMPRLRIWMTGVFVLLAALFASAMFDEGSALCGWALVAAALVHLGITAWFSLELQRHAGLRLLVLRVFGVDDKAAFTFGSVLAVWGFFGNYFTVIDPSYWRHANKLWSGASLGRVLGTLALLGVVYASTSDLLTLLTPRYEHIALAITGLAMLAVIVFTAYRAVDSQCIRSQGHLHKVLSGLDRRPRGLDVAFRNLVVPCHDNTWQIAVAEFVRRANVVLMDLRGFSTARKGCQWEVNLLLDVLPVEQVVFLVDRSSDLALVEQLLADCWRKLHRDSPNLANPAPQARIYAAGNEDEGDVQGLLNLLITTASAAAARGFDARRDAARGASRGHAAGRRKQRMSASGR